MTTPMRRQYLELKGQYPNCILFFRLGDFYETFDDDAKIVAEVCDVVLTSRPVGDNQRVPLAGVPYHSVEGYIARLVSAGYKVAVAEQVSEPGNGLVDREIQHVVTKGTITEPSMLDDDRNNYLVAVTFSGRGSEAGIAYCDITTGEFAATQINGNSSEEIERRVGEELGRLQPSELIVADWAVDQTTLGPLIAALGPVISTVEPWRVELETAQRSLEKQFRVNSLDGFGLQRKTQAIRAAAAVLAYLQEMQPSALSQLTSVHSYEIGEFMTLDESTRRNLELVETIRSGQVKGSLLGVLDETLTPMGGRLLRRWLGQPLLNVSAIEERLDAVEAFFQQSRARMEIRELLRGLGDLERWTNRVIQGRAQPRDLVGIRGVLQKIPEIRSGLGKGDRGLGIGDWRDIPLDDTDSPPIPNPQSPIPNLMDQLPACEDILALLEAAIADEPPATLANTGIIRQGYHEELDSIVHRSRHAKEWVANLEKSERERLDVKSLKVGYNKVFGYYIEITNTHQHKVPADYIRKQTLANCERYITPELKEYESLILNADERRLEMEQRLFRQICDQIIARAERLLQLANGLARLDVYCTLAEVALKRRYCRPQIEDGPVLVIAGGRHPVVELTSPDPFVPNDTHLAPDAAIHILTGPNMSGKSTYLRQTALITLMAQIGSFVPAESARIGLVDRIFTRIGASDEIHRGQSTFMVEMVETANILNHATGRSLLVLDEIGRGTSTYDGLAIAWAVVEYIHNHPSLRAKTLFATHYHELTDLSERLPHVINYHVAVDDSGEAVVFLHRILPGKADRSYGVHVAQIAGLPKAVVHRAEEILADLERSGAAGPRRITEMERQQKKASKTATQIGLFADIHPAIQALRALDLNGLTPLDALNRLYELQKLVQSEKN
ncbi:MAG: DNA mismatch repair protein MutS [Caldilineaceae bacterium]|nr:DNA mismatch repair protein MutS [Caldilineaceae bacterium]